MRSRMFGRAESNVSERARKMEGNVEFSDNPNNSIQQNTNKTTANAVNIYKFPFPFSY